jgi:very-short-patch-repair endonuclease
VREQERLYADLHADLTRKYQKLADLATAARFGVQIDPAPWQPLVDFATGRSLAPLPKFTEWLDAAADVAAAQRFFHCQFRKEPAASEAILWQALRGKQLDGRKFRRQQPIGPFVVDFFCPSERLIVEVDGPIHDQQRDADHRRQELLESLGLRFVRLATAQVHVGPQSCSSST